MIEAIAAGCFPILPDRLSYPELIPAAWHSQALYERDSLLVDRLAAALEQPLDEQAKRELATHARRFDWHERAEAFDDAALDVVLKAARRGRERSS